MTDEDQPSKDEQVSWAPPTASPRSGTTPSDEARGNGTSQQYGESRPLGPGYDDTASQPRPSGTGYAGTSREAAPARQFGEREPSAAQPGDPGPEPQPFGVAPGTGETRRPGDTRPDPVPRFSEPGPSDDARPEAYGAARDGELREPARPGASRTTPDAETESFPGRQADDTVERPAGPPITPAAPGPDAPPPNPPGRPVDAPRRPAYPQNQTPSQFGAPGNLSAPGNPGTSGNLGASGNPGTPGNPGGDGHQGAPDSQAVPGNPGGVGNPGGPGDDVSGPGGQYGPDGRGSQGGQYGPGDQYGQRGQYGAGGRYGPDGQGSYPQAPVFQAPPSAWSSPSGPGGPGGSPGGWSADLGSPRDASGPQPTAPAQPYVYGPQPLPGPGDTGAHPWGAPPLPGRSRSRMSGRASLIAAALGVGLLAGVLGGFGGSALYDDVADASGQDPTVSLPEPVKDNRDQTAGEVTAVASAVTPSVVSLEVSAGTSEGTGSGFVIDADKGYILTNNHVVSAETDSTASSIQVVFQDGTQAKGTVVGADSSYDLAVVKVKAKGLRELTFGDSDDVQVGDPVVAIGAPLGLTGTVTTGIVSALNRPVAAGEGDTPAYINAIQTDAAINPGNSGGPLVNAAGHVIAVNSAIARVPDTTGSSTSGSIGLGFAIPSNQAQRTAEQLIRTGKAEHPIIGVTLDSTYTGQGVLVSEKATDGQEPVTSGGPADQAGIQPGDVITKFNNRPVTAPDELIVAIRAQAPGDTVTLTIRRDGGSEKDVKVKLSASSD